MLPCLYTSVASVQNSFGGMMGKAVNRVHNIFIAATLNTKQKYKEMKGDSTLLHSTLRQNTVLCLYFALEELLSEYT